MACIVIIVIIIIVILVCAASSGSNNSTKNTNTTKSTSTKEVPNIFKRIKRIEVPYNYIHWEKDKYAYKDVKVFGISREGNRIKIRTSQIGCGWTPDKPYYDFAKAVYRDEAGDVIKLPTSNFKGVGPVYDHEGYIIASNFEFDI